MGRKTRRLDSLRLFALGRIPRCKRCPRFRALASIHSGAAGAGAELPAVPAFCNHQICAPLVARYATPVMQPLQSAVGAV